MLMLVLPELMLKLVLPKLMIVLVRVLVLPELMLALVLPELMLMLVLPGLMLPELMLKLVLLGLMLMLVLPGLMLMLVRAAELNAVNRRADVRQGQLDNSGYLPGECCKQQCSVITTVLRRVLTWGMLQETIGSMRSTIPVI